MPITPPVFVTALGPSASFLSDAGQHNFTVAAPAQSALIIACTYNGGTPQTPTIDGSTTGVVLLASQLSPSPSLVGVNVYYFLNPTAGTKVIRFQSTGATFITLTTRHYRSVNQVTPFGTPVQASGTDAAGVTLSLNVPTTAGLLVIDALQWRGSSGTRTGTVGAGQTQRANGSGNTEAFGASEETATGATTTMSWTLSSASPVWAYIAAVLNGFNDVQETVLNAAGVGAAAFVGNYYVPSALSAAGVATVSFVGFNAAPEPESFEMSKSNTYETDVLALLFNGTAIANIAINATASPLTNLFVALHTADPGEAGDQTSNETAYTGYARQTVARNSGGFVVASGSVSPAANIDFPVCTAVPGTTITHASIGVAVSGASKILYKGAITPQIAIAVGVIPRLTPASVITED